MADPVDTVELKIVEQATNHADMMRLQRLKFLRGDISSVLDADIAATVKRLSGPTDPGGSTQPATQAGPGGQGTGQPAQQDQQAQAGGTGSHAPPPSGGSP